MRKYRLFRVYVWYKDKDGWMAEGKWDDNKMGSLRMTGTIKYSGSGTSLPKAIDEVLAVARQMGIEERKDMWLSYHEIYEGNYRSIFFPSAGYKNVIRKEAYKRGWTSYND
ncbi:MULTISPECIES: hypothetical protein [Bacillaceae]|uniref:hypothetical protein n=1 Tax=Bacillaceae TaxID=186817 RepID=UPI001BDE0605|nr:MULTISPECIES: hypothetical protein [Bacillaceae]MDX8363459.1 hypothetical protein [Cytobacillus sp. IB215316]